MNNERYKEYKERKKGNLVHFTSIESLMKILVSDSIRLSNISSVNDSYEFLGLELGGYQEPLTEIGEAVMQSITYKIDEHAFDEQIKQNELAKQVSSYKKDLYVACFYDLKLNMGELDDYEECDKTSEEYISMLEMNYSNINKPSMWAHYGDQNKGVALIFDKEKLIEIFENQFKEEDFIREHKRIDYISGDEMQELFQITYANKIIRESKRMKNSKYIEYHKKAVQEEIIKDYYFKKHDDWGCENEYRFLLFDKAKNNLPVQLLKGITSAIRGISFGIKATDSDIGIIHNVLDLKDLDVIGVVSNKDLMEHTFYRPFYKKYERFYIEIEEEEDIYIEEFEEEIEAKECKCEYCLVSDQCEYYSSIDE